MKDQVERAYAEHNIASKHLEDELKNAATEAEAAGRRGQEGRAGRGLQGEHPGHRRGDDGLDRARGGHARGDQEGAEAREPDDGRRPLPPARLRPHDPDVPHGLRRPRASACRTSTTTRPTTCSRRSPGSREAEFRLLRDGQEVTEEDGTVTKIPGLFDEAVFDQSVQEFLDKKEALADYFDDAQTENIFAYIPQQKTSLVFTPQPVVKKMVDTLEAENPGIFTDPDKTFADLFSTAGLFLMELVRRLDTGLADVFPDQDERLRHILTSQIFEMSHNEILHRITIEAVSGGVPERKRWIEDSGHFRVGNLARMSPEERQKLVDDMLTEGRLTMSKKFDVVIGNPPYQEEAQGAGTRDTPVYHLFMDAAYEVGEEGRADHPGTLPVQRGLHAQGVEQEDAGRSAPDGPALRARQRRAVSRARTIKGGIAVTYWDEDRDGEPIGTFTKYPELNTILHKVVAVGDASIESRRDHELALLPRTRTSSTRTTQRPGRCDRQGNAALVNTNTFEQFSFVYHDEQPADGHEYVAGPRGSTRTGAHPAGFAASTSLARRASTSSRSRSRPRTGPVRQQTCVERRFDRTRSCSGRRSRSPRPSSPSGPSTTRPRPRHA